MEHSTFSSPAIAKEIELAYGSSTEVLTIEMEHQEEVKKYVMKIEEARAKAAKSTLVFP